MVAFAWSTQVRAALTLNPATRRPPIAPGGVREHPAVEFYAEIRAAEGVRRGDRPD